MIDLLPVLLLDNEGTSAEEEDHLSLSLTDSGFKFKISLSWKFSGWGFPSFLAEFWSACRCSLRTSGPASATPSTTRPTTWRRCKKKESETSAVAAALKKIQPKKNENSRERPFKVDSNDFRNGFNGEQSSLFVVSSPERLTFVSKHRRRRRDVVVQRLVWEISIRRCRRLVWKTRQKIGFNPKFETVTFTAGQVLGCQEICGNCFILKLVILDKFS